MEYSRRAEYIVIKDFESPIYLPISKIPVQYKKGDKVNLRLSGKVAKEWLEKGYVELVKGYWTVRPYEVGGDNWVANIVIKYVDLIHLS